MEPRPSDGQTRVVISALIILAFSRKRKRQPLLAALRPSTSTLFIVGRLLDSLTIPSWLQVPVYIYRHLYACVPELILDVGQGLPVLNQQTGVGVPQVMKADGAKAGRIQTLLEVPGPPRLHMSGGLPSSLTKTHSGSLLKPFFSHSLDAWSSCGRGEPVAERPRGPTRLILPVLVACIRPET